MLRRSEKMPPVYYHKKKALCVCKRAFWFPVALGVDSGESRQHVLAVAIAEGVCEPPLVLGVVLTVTISFFHSTPHAFSTDARDIWPAVPPTLGPIARIGGRH